MDCCEYCFYYEIGECHLQCTHPEYDEDNFFDEDGDCDEES